MEASILGLRPEDSARFVGGRRVTETSAASTAVVLLGLALLTVASLPLETVVLASGSGWSFLWVGLLAILFSWPILRTILLRGGLGQVDWFSPAIFPVWTYLAPVFIVGSLLLVSGLSSQPMPAGLVPEPAFRYYSLALAYFALGWAGWLLGYSWRGGERVGGWIERRLPVLEWGVSEIRVPSIGLLLVGLALHGLAFMRGLVGFQRVAIIGRFDALLVYSSWLAQLAIFLLWFSLFRRETWSLRERVLAVALFSLGPLFMLLSGGRAALLVLLILIACAYGLTGRDIRLRHLAIFAGLALVSLFIGTAWGTTYRHVKGNEEVLGKSLVLQPSVPRSDPRISEGGLVVRPKSERPQLARDDDMPAKEAQQSTSAQPLVAEASSLWKRTLQASTDRGPLETVAFVATVLGQRIEITSSLAVVAANYQRLRHEEEAAGIADNIWRDTWTAFIPRALWPGKPYVSDARTYSGVYFRFAENSFAITPVGDLLRNFGPAGIAVGMALLGCALRIVYRTLVDRQVGRAPRVAVYFAIMTGVSYEGFYGSLLPIVMRLSAVAVAGLLLVHCQVLALRWLRRSGASGAPGVRPGRG